MRRGPLTPRHPRQVLFERPLALGVPERPLASAARRSTTRRARVPGGLLEPRCTWAGALRRVRLLAGGGASLNP